MDFDFYKNFDVYKTVRTKSTLTKKIIKLDSILNLEIKNVDFPKGHEEYGDSIELRIIDDNIRKKIIEDLCAMLINEVKKESNYCDNSNWSIISDLIQCFVTFDVNGLDFG